MVKANDEELWAISRDEIFARMMQKNKMFLLVFFVEFFDDFCDDFRRMEMG